MKLRLTLRIVQAMLEQGMNDAAYLYLRRALADANKGKIARSEILRAMHALRNGGLVQ